MGSLFSDVCCIEHRAVACNVQLISVCKRSLRSDQQQQRGGMDVNHSALRHSIAEYDGNKSPSFNAVRDEPNELFASFGTIAGPR